ncbi:MAG: hypothetical protein KA408_12270 [Flavobacteriales bacterium]|nr:hypothetical protein [Flavobacteriales bacterium]
MNIPDDIRIKRAHYLADHSIRFTFTFTDGHLSEIDLYPFQYHSDI